MGCHCDFEPPEFFIETFPKARTQHRCGECCGTIRPGETYQHIRGKWDGEVATHKICPDCRDLRRWAEAHAKCICISLGGMHFDILEELHEMDADCPGIYAEARSKIDAIRVSRRSQETSHAEAP